MSSGSANCGRKLAFDSGFSITGGQMWSLATENRKGIQNRREALPMMIDPQYVVGFTWQRAYSLRVTQSLFDNKLTVGASIEGPQTTSAGAASLFSPTLLAPLHKTSGMPLLESEAVSTTSSTLPVTLRTGLPTSYSRPPSIPVGATMKSSASSASSVPAFILALSLAFPRRHQLRPTLTCVRQITRSLSWHRTAVGAFNDSRTGGGGGASFRVPLFRRRSISAQGRLRRWHQPLWLGAAL